VGHPLNKSGCATGAARPLLEWGSSMNMLDLLAVASEEGVPADDGDLFEHLDAVFEIAHAAALVVSPAHGHLDDVVTALEGDEENLGVEAPTLDGLKLEDGLRGGAGEGLESTLRIGKAEPHDAAGDGIETAPEKLPVEGLAMGLAAALKPAGADGDVSTLGNGVKEAFRLLDGRREVRIREHDHLSQGLEDAEAHTVALAAVGGVLDEANLGGMGGKGPHHGGRRVARSVVDHDNLRGPTALADAGDDRLKRRGNAGALIESRNHNAVLRILRHATNHPLANAPIVLGRVFQGKTLDMITRAAGVDPINLGREVFCHHPAHAKKPNSERSCLFFALSGAESGYAVSGGLENMTKADLVEKVTGLGDLTRRDGEVIVETIFGSVIGALQGGDKIEIRGFGSFRIRQRNPRIGRNPKTGERVEVPAKRVPYFKPSKELRDLVNPGEAAKAS